MAGARDLQSRRREEMVDRQIAWRGVRSNRVLEAMRSVPREEFIAPEMVEFAYEDTALPIAADQTISQPFIVALMIEALDIEPSDRVLEVGTGSGYAAAVLAHLAARVHTIERHRSLAEAAEHALERLGYDNVHVLHGDGMLGWESEAPFDAILVSAGGEEVPQGLKEQLAPGGRLVMPVGRFGEVQELTVFQKRPGGTLTRQSLGPVRFVPLLGDVTGAPAETARPETRPARGDVDLVRRHARAFDAPASADLGEAVERMAGHRAVLLGEASHGTSEFYVLRERLTRELIQRGAIDFVAVEADWPDAARLDGYVRGLDVGHAREPAFQRFPRWMWANRETLAFLRWLRDFNQGIDDPDERIGFFGLDLYSLHSSIEAVIAYLEDVDLETAHLARRRFACLTPWERDPHTYGRLVTTGRMQACEDQVVDVLLDLLEQRERYVERDGTSYMHAMENARLVTNAERYYRVMYRSPSESWNLRDQHMFDTLRELLTYHGPGARAAVWAHNSHLGDASATDMGARGQHNLGQLCRTHVGRKCYAVGMGTHTGTVLAAHDWGEPGEVMDVRPSLTGSHERLSHDAEIPAFFLPMRGNGELTRALARERIQRAIGVIYRPDTERASHYFHASLSRQFDEWAFLDRTEAVAPLGAAREGGLEAGAPETYPFAL